MPKDIERLGESLISSESSDIPGWLFRFAALWWGSVGLRPSPSCQQNAVNAQMSDVL